MVEWVKLVLDETKNISFEWYMQNKKIHCTLRRTPRKVVWYGATMRGQRHNCVSSKPGSGPGVLVQSRHDTSDMVAWLEEEIVETLIRCDIIQRIKAGKDLIPMLVKKAERMGNTGTPITYTTALGVDFVGALRTLHK
jgi:hypothetical protein